MVGLGRDDCQDLGGVKSQENGLVADEEAVEEGVRGVCGGVLHWVNQ